MQGDPGKVSNFDQRNLVRSKFYHLKVQLFAITVTASILKLDFLKLVFLSGSITNCLFGIIFFKGREAA